MPPPGVNTTCDHLDIMTFPSTYGSVSSTLKSTFSVTSSLPRNSISEQLSALSSIHSDHDYHIKSYIRCEDYTYRMVTDSHYHYCDTVDCDNSGDAMLSSYAVDTEKLTGDGTDTDFLKDLDDLSFSFNDPCCEVAMEDSFQEFIDSALEQSYSPFFGDLSDDEKPVQGEDAVILNKDQFLASLRLRPTREYCGEWSTSSPTFSPRELSFNSLNAADKTHIDTNYQQSLNLNMKTGYPNNDVIPTRQCSCVESVFKAVYSTAHPPLQECVRTCPSTLNTAKNNKCTEFPQNKISESLISPLFIDTSPNGLTRCLQSTSEGCLDIMVEDDAPWRIDNETGDIMKWLSESQQENYQHSSDGNNNIVYRVCVGEDTIFAETSNESSVVAPSLDLESFVDLDEFDTEITDRNYEFVVDDTCQRTTDQSKITKSVACISKLKLSLLTEHLHNNNNKYRHGSFSDVYSESSHTEKLSPKSSDLSYCGLSPAWSRTDSIHSAISPVPISSMDTSWSSNCEDATDDASVKSPFALLNLFSDENAISLLHTDSTVPNIRFM